MSYILDALRKADAERERGSVPSIHAQPSFAGARPAGPAPASRLWIVVAVIGALLALVAAMAAYLLLGHGPASEVAKPAGPPPSTVAAAPAAPVAPTPAPVTVAPALPAPPPPVRKARAAPAASAPPAATPTAAASAPGSTPRPPPAAKTEERIYTLDELPDDIRRQLPALSVGGSMYSPTPASRLVIINGQVLREGEHITPDLLVQQIRLKSAVMSFKGYRYTLAF
jgi:general secretion pathway protein B